jgi:hypothetical protein
MSSSWPLDAIALSGALIPPCSSVEASPSSAAPRADSGVAALLAGTVVRESAFVLFSTPLVAGVDLAASAAAGFGAAATTALSAGAAAAAACCDAGCVGGGAAAGSPAVSTVAAHASCAFVALAALADAGAATLHTGGSSPPTPRAASAAPLEASLLTAHALLEVLDARNKRVKAIAGAHAASSEIAKAFAEGVLPSAAIALERLTPPQASFSPSLSRAPYASLELPTIRQLLHHGLRAVAVTGGDDGSSSFNGDSCPTGFATHYLFGAPVSKGKWYYEVGMGHDRRTLQIGWASDRAKYELESASSKLSRGVGDDDFSWSWCAIRHKAYHGSGKPDVEYPPKSAKSSIPKPVRSKDIVGVLFDMDAGTIEFTCNGVSAGVCHRNVKVQPKSDQTQPSLFVPAISTSDGPKAKINAGLWPAGAAEDWKSGVTSCGFAFPPANRSFLPIAAAAAGGVGIPGVNPTEPTSMQWGFGAPQCLLFRTPGSVGTVMTSRCSVAQDATPSTECELADSSNGFTVEALVRTDQSGGSRDSWASVARGATPLTEPATILARGTDGSGGWALQITALGGLLFTAFSATSAPIPAEKPFYEAIDCGGTAQSGDGVVLPNVWTHVAAVVNPTFHEIYREIKSDEELIVEAQNVSLYVNGRVVFSGPLSPRVSFSASPDSFDTSRYDGQNLKVHPVTNADSGVFFSVGARLPKETSPPKPDEAQKAMLFAPFFGRLAYVRIWATARSVASLRDTMHRCALLPSSSVGFSLNAARTSLHAITKKDGGSVSRATLAGASNSKAAVRRPT